MGETGNSDFMRLAIRGRLPNGVVNAWQIAGTAPPNARFVTITLDQPSSSRGPNRTTHTPIVLHVRCKEKIPLPPGIPLESNKSYWSSILYTAEHPDLYQLSNWINEYQSRVRGSPDPSFPKLRVTLEAHFPDREKVQKNDPVSQEKPDRYRIESHISAASVTTYTTYDAGVLLVHGIGWHKQGNTLVGFSEPLLKFYENWLDGITDSWIESNGDDAFVEWARKSINLGLAGRADKGGLYNKIERYSESVGRYNDVFEPLDPDDVSVLNELKSPKKSDIVMGVVRVQRTVFHPDWPDPDRDAYSAIRISTLDQNGVLDEAYLVIQESWWSDNAALPRFSELVSWGSSQLPMVVDMYLGHMRNLYLDESGNSKVRGFMVKLLFVGLLRPLGLATVVIMNIVLLLLMLLSLIPLAFIKRLITPVVNILLGTTGQSFALTHSPLRRSAISQATQTALENMDSKTVNTIVISHSQGAEVARHVLERENWPNVLNWVSFGAGINLLNLIVQKSLPKDYRLWVYAASAVLLPVLLYPLVKFLSPSLGSFLTAVFNPANSIGPGVIYLVIVYIVLVLLGMRFDGVKKVKLNPSRLTGSSRFQEKRPLNWTNYYATHDPVPCGEIEIWVHPDHKTGISGSAEDEDGMQFSELKLNYRSRQVQNFRSVVLDHTAYFKNIPQFVVPVALKIAETAGLDLFSKDDDSENRIKQAAVNQEKMARHLGILRTAFLIIMAACIYAVASAAADRWPFSGCTGDGIWNLWCYVKESVWSIRYVIGVYLGHSLIKVCIVQYYSNKIQEMYVRPTGSDKNRSKGSE